MVIAIDGPAGARKITTAKEFAKKHGYTYIDTGAMYRAVALYMEEHHVSGEEEVKKLLPYAQVSFRPGTEGQKIFLNGEEVTDKIRTEEVIQAASRLSALPCVREHLLRLQRDAVKYGDIIMEGRDIGSVVFPDAGLKVFLTAPINVRASRRATEIWKKGGSDSYRSILESMRERDIRDRSREVSPLTECEGSVRIDNQEMDIDSVVSYIWYLAEPKKCLETAIEDFSRSAAEMQLAGGSGKLTPLVVSTMLNELSGYKELGISGYEVSLLLKSMARYPEGNRDIAAPDAAVIPVAGTGVEIGPPEQMADGKLRYTVSMNDSSVVHLLYDGDTAPAQKFVVSHAGSSGIIYQTYAEDMCHAIVKLAYYMTGLAGKGIFATLINSVNKSPEGGTKNEK